MKKWLLSIVFSLYAGGSYAYSAEYMTCMSAAKSEMSEKMSCVKAEQKAQNKALRKYFKLYKAELPIENQKVLEQTFKVWKQESRVTCSHLLGNEKTILQQFSSAECFLGMTFHKTNEYKRNVK
jgi:uncharacterized protein YecT (DUF1311 family)